MAPFNYDLHMEVQANLVEKLSILHPRAMSLKPSLSAIYAESNTCIEKNHATYARNIPYILQLPFIFAHYNDIVHANRTALKSSVQSTNVSRAIWYWGIDPTHSFFKDHEQIRYNIILMTLVSMSADPNEYTTIEGQHFAWVFIMAWVEQLENKGNFTYRDHFIDIWKTGQYDLIVFTEAQKQRVKYAIRALKEKIGKGSKQQAMGEVSSVVAERFRAFRGAEWSLRWCFVHEESLGIGQEFGVDSVMEVDIDDKVLCRVNWGAPMLKSLLSSIDRYPDTMEDEINPFWLDTAKALELVEDEGGDATDAMTQLFGGMSI